MSQAKPRRESNPKLVQRFPLYAAPLAIAVPHRTVVANLHKMAFINPRFVRKKQGFAGAKNVSRPKTSYIALIAFPITNIDWVVQTLRRAIEKRFSRQASRSCFCVKILEA